MRHGESFEDVLKANGATPEAILAILAAFGVKARANRRSVMDKRSSFFPAEPAMRGQKPKIARVSIYSDDQLKATVAINDSGA